MYRISFLFAGILFLSSCATPYKADGNLGGFGETQLDDNVFSVYFRGNAFIEQRNVKTYLLYRCAELTLEKGYDYFVIVGADTEATRGAIVTPGSYSSTTTGHATAYGNSAYGSAYSSGTYMPAQATPYTKYTSEATIKLFKGVKPHSLASSYQAKKLMGYLEVKIQR